MKSQRREGAGRPKVGLQMPRLMTSTEVAQVLQVDPSTLSRWRMLGRGPRVVWLSPGSPRYLQADIERWLEKVAK